jgi:hypothetical protein
MKMTKAAGFFAAGILAALLAGCVNPVSSVPAEAKEADASIDGPLTVTLSIGEDESTRAYAGPTFNMIKFGGLRNITDLIVVDTEAKEIVSFDRVLKRSSAETSATLQVDNITFGKNYAFMMLMGYQKPSAITSTVGLWATIYHYSYDDLIEPTLMVAGVTQQVITGPTQVPITIRPIPVDTLFTSDNEL